MFEAIHLCYPMHLKHMCLKIYELAPACFYILAELAWQTVLKRKELKLELFTDIDISLMVEQFIRNGICHAIHRYVKTNNKYMKVYYKNKEPLYVKYWNVYNLY